MTSQLSLAAAIFLALFAGGARAQPACALPYAFFELAVPHLDLEACPASLARDKAFCRATAAHDGVHVFVFAQDGDQCLLSTRSFSGNEYQLTVK